MTSLLSSISRHTNNVDVGKKAFTNDLPDESKDEMFATFRNIRRANIDNRAPDTLGRRDDNIVVFRNLEIVKWLVRRFVEDTGIDCVWDGVVDQFTEDQPVSTLVEDLHRIGWDRHSGSNIRIAFKNAIDVVRELSTFVLVDSMANIRV